MGDTSQAKEAGAETSMPAATTENKSLLAQLFGTRRNGRRVTPKRSEDEPQTKAEMSLVAAFNKCQFWSNGEQYVELARAVSTLGIAPERAKILERAEYARLISVGKTHEAGWLREAFLEVSKGQDTPEAAFKLVLEGGRKVIGNPVYGDASMQALLFGSSKVTLEDVQRYYNQLPRQIDALGIPSDAVRELIVAEHGWLLANANTKQTTYPYGSVAPHAISKAEILRKVFPQFFQSQEGSGPRPTLDQRGGFRPPKDGTDIGR